MSHALKILLFTTLLVGVGCGTAHQGLYESVSAEGWVRVEDNGVSFFHPPSMRLSKGFVSFATPQKGEIFVAIHFPGHSTTFEKEEIHLIPHDGAPAQVLPFSSEPIILPATSDFTIVIPAFLLDDHPVPALKARFKWSDRRYRAWGGGW